MSRGAPDNLIDNQRTTVSRSERPPDSNHGHLIPVADDSIVHIGTQRRTRAKSGTSPLHRFLRVFRVFGPQRHCCSVRSLTTSIQPGCVRIVSVHEDVRLRPIGRLEIVQAVGPADRSRNQSTTSVASAIKSPLAVRGRVDPGTAIWNARRVAELGPGEVVTCCDPPPLGVLEPQHQVDRRRAVRLLPI